MVGEPGDDDSGVVADREAGGTAAGPGRSRAAQLPQNRDVSGFSDWQ
jgi:hypothetical protein